AHVRVVSVDVTGAPGVTFKVIAAVRPAEELLPQRPLQGIAAHLQFHRAQGTTRYPGQQHKSNKPWPRSRKRLEECCHNSILLEAAGLFQESPSRTLLL